MENFNNASAILFEVLLSDFPELFQEKLLNGERELIFEVRLKRINQPEGKSTQIGNTQFNVKLVSGSSSGNLIPMEENSHSQFPIGNTGEIDSTSKTKDILPKPKKSRPLSEAELKTVTLKELFRESYKYSKFIDFLKSKSILTMDSKGYCLEGRTKGKIASMVYQLKKRHFFLKQYEKLNRDEIALLITNTFYNIESITGKNTCGKLGKIKKDFNSFIETYETKRVDL